MLKLEEVKKISYGKGVLVQKLGTYKYRYNALVRGNHDDHLSMVTENGAFSKPLYKTYGKTWCVERIN